MKKLQIYFKAILIVSLISGFALFLSMLALNDVMGGNENDLTTEWTVIRLSYFLNGTLCLLLLITIFQAKKLFFKQKALK